MGADIRSGMPVLSLFHPDLPESAPLVGREDEASWDSLYPKAEMLFAAVVIPRLSRSWLIP